MIPRPIAPLTALSILVTRPAEQNAALCARIAALGGEAIAFPAIAIEALPGPALTGNFDLAIFVSVNAVRHGLARVVATRIAAIGPATANALAAANVPVDLVAPAPYTSEALLTLPELQAVQAQRIAIVRGAGGRDTLRDALIERGAQVEYLDVYRRVRAQSTPAELAALNERWLHGINIVTLTSVEILDHLLALLDDRSRDLLKHTPFVAASERIEVAARTHSLHGTSIRARGADDESILGAIARWHARAKT